MASTAERRHARGLALRMDHGSQYLSDHFTVPDQVLAASQPSYDLRRRAPEGRTVVRLERFSSSHAEWSTLRSSSWSLSSSACTGSPLRCLSEDADPRLRSNFLQCPVDRAEKNGYLSPAQARQAWHAAISIRQKPRERPHACAPKNIGCATGTRSGNACHDRPRPIAKTLPPAKLAHIYHRTPSTANLLLREKLWESDSGPPWTFLRLSQFCV